MKVRDLIKKLLNYNLDADIAIKDSFKIKQFDLSYVTDRNHKNKKETIKVYLDIKDDT